jgi:glycosyltransferase involved in cell wall biosynthesis
LGFQEGEIVIAAGTFTIHDVYDLPARVHKVRYCLGFNEHLSDLTESAWGLPMPTVSLSDQLLTKLEEISGKKPLGAVPSGIRRSQYYDEGIEREGIGGIYYDHFKKAPEVMIEVLRRAGLRWPRAPQYVFSMSKRPKGLDQARFFRYPSVDKARELYNRSKVWIVTSRSEGFCLPIIEAMACGCAVVSTDHDSAPGLIRDGDNGFLVPIGDVDAFMDRIGRLLEDEGLRRNVAAAAAATVERFTWERSAEMMEHCLDKLVAQAQ